MSTEPVKKRGRPRKVALATDEATMVSQKQEKGGTKGDKQPSRKATERTSTDLKGRKRSKTDKSDLENNSAIEEKPVDVDTQVIQRSHNSSPNPSEYKNSKILQELAARASTTPAISHNSSQLGPTLAHLPSPPPTPLNIASSPILQQAAKSTTISKPTSIPKTLTSSKTTTSSRKTTSSTRPKETNNSLKSSDPVTPSKTPSPSTVPKPSKPSPPSAKEINASIVNTLSARPGPGSGAAQTRNPPPVGRMDPRYKAALRRWTSIIVGLPIAIVTSWMLYERLVLGKDKSSFENVGLSDVKKAVQRLGMAKEEHRREDGRGEVKTEEGQ